MSALPLSISLNPHSSFHSLSIKLSALDWRGLSFTYRVAWQKWQPYLTSHQRLCDGQQLLPIRTVLLVKPCSVFCLSMQAPASVCQCHISWSCHVWRKKKVLLPRRKALRSRRNATLAPAGAAELSDVMKRRRWRLMPLRSKESGSLKQKVCAIKRIVWKYSLADKSDKFYEVVTCQISLSSLCTV